MEQQATPEQIKEKILEIFKANDAISIASTGGEYSPWILGAYFASEGLTIYCFLETAGKSYRNIFLNKSIAISISKNDAMQDFLQGKGTIEMLPNEDEDKVRNMILAKMPWFKTYTPVAPCRIKIDKFFVTSLQSGWFPAKVLEP
jgi:nitroimidazol reductase NimA-like FMN-containing flavoprotein (pyridoxamine 5'-phosphate oxidase superfamily)